MANTTPDNIYYPTGGSQITPLETVFANTANTVQGAITNLRNNVGPFLSSGATPGVIPAGTTAQRNTYWGSPATGTERVALALKGARWLNTSTGVTEQYFSTVGDPLAVLSMSAMVGGWYPISGLSAYSWKTSAQTFPSSGSAEAIAYEKKTLSGGITYDDKVFTVPVTGIYRLFGTMGNFANSAGSSRWFFIAINGVGRSVSLPQAQTTFSVGGDTRLWNFSDLQLLTANDKVRFMALHTAGTSTTLSDATAGIEYLRPANN